MIYIERDTEHAPAVLEEAGTKPILYVPYPTMGCCEPSQSVRLVPSADTSPTAIVFLFFVVLQIYKLMPVTQLFGVSRTRGFIFLVCNCGSLSPTEEDMASGS